MAEGLQSAGAEQLGSLVRVGQVREHARGLVQRCRRKRGGSEALQCMSVVRGAPERVAALCVAAVFAFIFSCDLGPLFSLRCSRVGCSASSQLPGFSSCVALHRLLFSLARGARASAAPAVVY